MVGRIVICSLVCGVAGTICAQQVEVPREQAITPRRITTQPLVEVRPQTIAYTEPAKPTAPALTVEQMRHAGALAAQKVRVPIQSRANLNRLLRRRRNKSPRTQCA
ncbi:MAG: hypothetical protein DME57_04865 [Verrucomicrobia bacterium]|nr:MAG: hypothetical protein DME57_04865 [Verrucomicrobiota bacterium]